MNNKVKEANISMIIFKTLSGLNMNALKYLSITRVALYGYLILIVATIVSLIVGQDRFSWPQMIAIVLICSSVYFVEIAESKETN